eukprot:CAMPEP_0194062488 /NCGR_PEP_ID=MMETSP0009_2-20130614/77737_1 /TAXON_ID=210454 /ORGANISM="Grammatophora oceanica, Strain CCMP 410" /LENGTH=66 /DNA_ID=CAMNT_0038714251 /DNA_START=46 /DNA_END=243 /DNA_ORIENTATION=-
MTPQENSGTITVEALNDVEPVAPNTNEPVAEQDPDNLTEIGQSSHTVVSSKSMTKVRHAREVPLVE